MAAFTHYSNAEERDPLAKVRRAFAEFLWLPTAIILGFLLLAVGAYLLDRTRVDQLEPVRRFLRTHIFTDAQATSELLGTIAGGIMTVTSVTISLLLLALQQSASAMTTEIFDQFLRRRHNQLYFGFFVGLTLYSLITLATVNQPFNPVFGASLAFLLTIVALYLLLVLLYTTINQMRPSEIIQTVRQHTLAARHHQLGLIRRTRRRPQGQGGVQWPVKTSWHGMVTQIKLEPITAAITEATSGATSGAQTEVEVNLMVCIGDYVAFQDTLATVQAPTLEAAAAVGKVVEAAIVLERERDITTDPAYGLEQLQVIAWSSISTAKSDLAPGLLTIYSLRDILSHWLAEEAEEAQAESKQSPVAVVYQDHTFTHLLNSLEALAIVSSESMQYQIFVQVIRTFADFFDRLPAAQQEHAEQIILHLLSALGDHVLTTELDKILSVLVERLNKAARWETATAVLTAQTKLRHSVGALHSRSTRTGKGERV